jgi:hypothetical protein
MRGFLLAFVRGSGNACRTSVEEPQNAPAGQAMDDRVSDSRCRTCRGRARPEDLRVGHRDWHTRSLGAEHSPADLAGIDCVPCGCGLGLIPRVRTRGSRIRRTTATAALYYPGFLLLAAVNATVFTWIVARVQVQRTARPGPLSDVQPQLSRSVGSVPRVPAAIRTHAVPSSSGWAGAYCGWAFFSGRPRRSHRRPDSVQAAETKQLAKGAVRAGLGSGLKLGFTQCRQD